MLRQIILLITLISFSVQVIAQELHLNIHQEVNKVLEPKEGGLDLKQIQDLTLNDQIDLKISYERLFQAQKKIAQARAEYFPYGLGTIAAMYFLNVWNPLILVELVTSLPSKWYNVQSEKNLRWAQKYSFKALEHNIKAQVAHLYYGLLKEEATLKLTEVQIRLMEKLLTAVKEEVELGISDYTDIENLEIRILDARDIYLKFSAYHAQSTAAFNQMISQDPEFSKLAKLQPVAEFNVRDEYTTNLEQAALAAVERAPEIVSADYMIVAARKAKKSIRWSVLSFSGIGFGYWSRVQVAGSKVEAAELNRELVETTIKNQVYVTHSAFMRAMDLFNAEEAISSGTSFFTEVKIEQFKGREVSLRTLLETELLFVKDYTETIVAHYDSLIKKIDFERAILGTAKDPSIQTNLNI